MTFEQLMKVANLASPFLLAAIGWLLKNALGRVTDRIERVEARTGANEAQISAVRETSVKREDWLRENTRTIQKLDKLCEGQARIEASVNVGAAVGEAVRELATTIRMERRNADN